VRKSTATVDRAVLDRMSGERAPSIRRGFGAALARVGCVAYRMRARMVWLENGLAGERGAGIRIARILKKTLFTCEGVTVDSCPRARQRPPRHVLDGEAIALVEAMWTGRLQDALDD
jgi:hypothetical protein